MAVVKPILKPSQPIFNNQMSENERERKEEEEEEYEWEKCCMFCSKRLTEEQQGCFDRSEGNWVAWCGLDKFATCDECMETMCNSCHGPCNDLCEECDGVCECYYCEGETCDCGHGCTCEEEEEDEEDED